jgi:hypothetical protein
MNRLLVCLVFGASAISIAQRFNRAAPTPAEWANLAKLPDFTGVWELSFRAPPARGSAPLAGRGRGGGPPALSLTPEFAARKKAFDANPPEDNETANCLPPGMPGIMGQPYPMEFLLTPGQVTIVIEAYTQVRHIYTDGRSLPEDPDQTFQGTSVGRWEGDSLLVDTVGFSPLTQIDRGVPHSDRMRIHERFRLTDPDTMSVETTVVDPTVLAAAFTSTRTLQRHRNWTIAEYVCEENNRNSVDAAGKAGVNLARPGPQTKKD